MLQRDDSEEQENQDTEVEEMGESNIHERSANHPTPVPQPQMGHQAQAKVWADLQKTSELTHGSTV
jgi:hypothetical protein